MSQVKRKIVATLAMLVVSAGLLPAQKAAAVREPKDAIHLNGTVSKIAGDTMTVAVSDQSADVKLLSTTTYKVGAKPGTAADITVDSGTRSTCVLK